MKEYLISVNNCLLTNNKAITKNTIQNYTQDNVIKAIDYYSLFKQFKNLNIKIYEIQEVSIVQIY